MALKGLKDIPLGRKHLVLGFYIGNHQREGERMLHTKCKLHAGHNNCLLSPREQDTEMFPRTAFKFLASADLRRHRIVQGAVTERGVCVNGSYMSRALSQKVGGLS